MQDSESWREKVARIIDLEAFLDRGPWASDRVRDTYLKRREAVLAKADAILSTLSPAPEGWRVVPVEPTEAMIRACVPPMETFGAVWAAMLSASPLPVGGGEERDSGASRDHAPTVSAVQGTKALDPEGEAKHTPGPWGVEITRSGAWVGPMRLDGVKVNEVVVPIECGDGYRRDFNVQQLANARLISAAPELLAACVAMVEAEDALLAELRAEGKLPDLTGNPWPHVDAMRAAIAKATGSLP